MTSSRLQTTCSVLLLRGRSRPMSAKGPVRILGVSSGSHRSVTISSSPRPQSSAWEIATTRAKVYPHCDVKISPVSPVHICLDCILADCHQRRCTPVRGTQATSKHSHAIAWRSGKPQRTILILGNDDNWDRQPSDECESFGSTSS
jgi:hypothetical protein